MSASIDRRLLLKTGVYGLGALGLPGGALAAMQASLIRGFSHGVASGEPSQNSVLLWTRYVSDSADTTLKAEISEYADFRSTVTGTETVASPQRDYTAKAVVRGLKPGQSYHYRFIAPNGSISPIGQTRTLPEGGSKQYRMAVFSCSNMPFGWFNAYAHAAQVGDFDIALHLGDYIYEYQRGDYPSAKDTVAGRLIEPANEIVSLADYRLRYASYRADTDLQAIHARTPMLCMWDDHEFANDAYGDGAQNHQANEGDWQVRKAAAEQAYREWMPVRDLDAGERWTGYRIGDLAEIFMTESRIGARSKPAELQIPKGADEAATLAALKAFTQGDWQSADRTMLGGKQESWLTGSFQNSKAKWNIWAQQTIMGTILQPDETVNWLAPDAPDFAKARVRRGAMAAKAGIPANLDAWDGYPKARARALASAQNSTADLIVLTGDSHNAWAFDLQNDGKAAGVEFAGQSVSSPGFETYFTGATPATVAKGVAAHNAGLKWMDSSRRGYMIVELTPERATSEWRFVETVKERNPRLAGLHRMTAKHGKRKLG
jgi:alkaline phosphatase D